MELQDIAAQLRKPEGDAGKEIGVVMNNGNALINEAGINSLKLEANDKVIEIGMGNGYFVKDIIAMDQSIKYYGLDYSEIMVDEAKRLNEKFVTTEQANFLVGIADQIPFVDNYFSKILTINTIYFWGNAEMELQEIKRVLDQNGTFVIAVRTKQTMEQMPFTQFGFVKYDRDELTTILQNNGFTIVDVHEQKEPEYEFNGRMIQLENIIVTCTKSKLTDIEYTSALE